jgi:iduronate 2-sulfatase
MHRIITVLLCMCSCVMARKNVLFFVSDDMRPNINAYSGPDFPSPVHPKMHTPNLDALAGQSLLAKRAYVQQAVCSPSRTSLLTGRRPDTTHVYNLYDYFRTVGGNYTTIPQYFKLHGYKSIGMGKVFHPGHASDNDDPISWSVPYFHAPNLAYWDERNTSWEAVSKERRRDKPLPDEQIAQHAIKTIKELAKTPQQPFFLAVGFHKPHLPFVFPEEFLQYYPQETVHLPDNPYAPVNMPDVAWYGYDGLRGYKDIHALNVTGKINTTIPAFKVLELRRAYYSALSFTDFLLGEVMGALRDHGLATNTIVSFVGDHGWQLGEHGEWCKQTNFELATHAPLLVHVPGMTERGIVTEQLTEFVDLFPTLVEAAGLPELPLCPPLSTHVALCREGASLMPLITHADPAWKQRVFSQYPRDKDYMGYTMRTPQYRYTEWVHFIGKPHYKPVWEENVGTELYDHTIDPEENYNHAGEKKYTEIQHTLSKQLRAGWREAIPSTQMLPKQSTDTFVLRYSFMDKSSNDAGPTRL